LYRVDYREADTPFAGAGKRSDTRNYLYRRLVKGIISGWIILIKYLAK